MRVQQAFERLPHGRWMDPAAFERRQRVLVVVLALHVPAVALVGALHRYAILHIVAETAPILVLAGLGIALRGRLARQLAVTAGLMYAGAVGVHFTGGLVEANFYYFVALGLIALYQDWRPFLFAVVGVIGGHGIVGVLVPTAVYNHPAALARPWLWALVHGAFFAAAAGVYTVFWKLAERQQEEAARSYRELVEGERAVIAQLRQAELLKEELVSVVGHEFRSPLTSIMGFAQTLTARLDDMDPDSARRSTRAIEWQAKRLTRMVSNFLTASSELTPAPDDAVDLCSVTDEVVADVIALAPAMARDVQVSVPPGQWVAMSEPAASQLLFNLLDNAVKFADHQTTITVATRREGDTLVLEVTNVGPSIPEADRERVFEAFVQGDSSETRRYGGIGLGLHIVRKITEAHGGRVGVWCDGPVVIFRTWLPVAERGADAVPAVAAPTRPAATSLPGR